MPSTEQLSFWLSDAEVALRQIKVFYWGKNHPECQMTPGECIEKLQELSGQLLNDLLSDEELELLDPLIQQKQEQAIPLIEHFAKGEGGEAERASIEAAMDPKISEAVRLGIDWNLFLSHLLPRTGLDQNTQQDVLDDVKCIIWVSLVVRDKIRECIGQQ